MFPAGLCSFVLLFVGPLLSLSDLGGKAHQGSARGALAMATEEGNERGRLEQIMPILTSVEVHSITSPSSSERPWMWINVSYAIRAGCVVAGKLLDCYRLVGIGNAVRQEHNCVPVSCREYRGYATNVSELLPTPEFCSMQD